MKKASKKPTKKKTDDEHPTTPKMTPTNSKQATKPSTEEISHYISFCFRSDIIKKLKHSSHPHILGTQLFEEETGVKIPLATSRTHLRRWMLIDGKLQPRKD